MGVSHVAVVMCIVSGLALHIPYSQYTLDNECAWHLIMLCEAKAHIGHDGPNARLCKSQHGSEACCHTVASISAGYMGL